MHRTRHAQSGYLDDKNRCVNHNHRRSRKSYHGILRCDGYLGMYSHGTFNGWTDGSISNVQPS